jgi:protein SCO1/2
MNRKKLRIAALALTAATLAGSGSARAAPKGSPWGANYFPNVTLVTQDGKEVRLYDDLIKDKLVVFSFIYTRCTKQCGLIAASLARVQRELGDRLGKDIFLYSISIDPERDTPEVLKKYAGAFHARPGWTFLTGKTEDVKLIRKKFGDLTPVEEHTANLNIGNDRTGQWMATGAIDDPKYLAMVIGDWLDPSWDKRKPVNSYADAPPAPTDQVALLYRDKCAACHSGDETVGPSLKGVVALRGEAWVARWLKEPEKMLEEKDPVATQLLARYGGVPMPNLELQPAQVSALIEYMKGAKKPASQSKAD